ncbi:hypothetical protein CRU98_06055 [Arcobacter sp. CECT 8986]|uniref:hypothetical protein n=1 Tax=Arcobacter sp. CECT 8986 TaxID=2044507 RepID=UPI001009A167|nr:hypothetical protein [Arcobacter sp. CECT 8986]RXJ99588.1 hypothetical protein CRU98_06055 [Arcobacter sp. CECT 8986]
MIVEKFSQNVVNSGIFKLYIATGFFATLIFFVINAELFTPLEMLFGIVGVTVVLKGVSNMMLSLIILLFNLDNKRKELDFKYNSEKIDAMLAELSIQDAANAGEKKE